MRRTSSGRNVTNDRDAAARAGGAGWFEILADHPAVPWCIAAAFALAGIAAVHARIFLNSEGIFTWIFSGLTSEAPLDMLFYLHSRPPISVFYAPVAALGLTPFLWAHVLVAALAVPLTASLARHFDQAHPNLPAMLAAVSPLLFAGAVSGVQNTDGTVGLLFAAWLMTRSRPFASGLVLSLVVLARIEIGLFALALAIYALVTPGRRRFLLAAPLLPAAYVLLGALYHGELLWPLKYPSFPTSDPTVTAADRDWYGGDVNHVVATVLGLTPVVGAALWASLRGWRPLEFVLCLSAILFVAAVRLLPFTQLIYVDNSPRYLLPALPFLCLTVNRGVARWGLDWRGTLARGAVLLLVAAAVVVAAVAGGGARRELVWFGGTAGPLAIAAAAVCVACAALAFYSKRAAAIGLTVAAAAGALPLFAATHLALGDHARQLDACARWIGEARLPDGAVVVTDLHLLRPWLDAYAPELDVDVRQLVAPDMLSQQKGLTNPATRQFEVIFGTGRFFYAPWIFADQIAALPGEVYFVMKNEDRRWPLSEPPFDRVEWLVRGDWLGGRLVRSAPLPARAAMPARPNRAAIYRSSSMRGRSMNQSTACSVNIVDQLHTSSRSGE